MKWIASFLVPVYAVPWVLLFLLRDAAAAGSVGAVLGWIFPVVWAPTVVALILLVAAGGPGEAWSEVKTRLGCEPAGRRWIGLAAAIPVLMTLLAVWIATLSGDGRGFVALPVIPVVLALQLTTGATGEELGWRGYLLPRLKSVWGEVPAAWAMAILWSLWHVPAFLFPGMPHATMAFVPTALFTAFFGVWLAAVFYRTGGSVLATMAAHLGLNATQGVGGVDLSSGVYLWSLAGLFGVLAVIGTVVLWRRSVAAPRQVVGS